MIKCLALNQLKMIPKNVKNHSNCASGITSGSNHNPSSNNSRRGGRGRGERGHRGRGGMYNKSNVECYNCHRDTTTMQMSANQKVIIMLPIVLKKIVITNKMKMIMQY